MVRLSVRGAEKMRDAAKQIRQAGRKDLRQHMTRRLRAAAKPVLADIRASARAIPVEGEPLYRYGVKKVVDADGQVRLVQVKRRTPRKLPSKGLRRRVAAATGVEIRTSGKPRLAFVVKPGRMPAGQGNLPRHLDSEKGWRHPVFGDREVWVRQRGKPWFWPPIRKHIKTFRAAVDAAITDTVQQIERS